MRRVTELNENEIVELKTRLFYEYLDSGDLDEILGDIDNPEDIPTDLVFTHYHEYFFVEEDFWCNTTEL